MNTIYKTQATIHADLDSAWGVIAGQSFSKDYFPEIKQNLSGMSDYVFRTQKKKNRVLPSYTIHKKAIGWVTGGSTDIRLTRKDVHANIKAIDIELIEKGENTTIKIGVDYAPKLDKNFFFAHRCIRGLIKTKLAVLKQELEVNNNEINLCSIKELLKYQYRRN